MKDKNIAAAGESRKNPYTELKESEQQGEKANIYAKTKTSCNHCVPLPKELENNFI